MKKALGLIETIGLAAAIEAADAAVKAADVMLLGYENTKGSGKITIKIAGNVGAVKAGVAAGIAAASRVGQVYGHLVIPRPHEEIEWLINHIDRGRGQSEPEPIEKEPEPVVEEGKTTVEGEAEEEPTAEEIVLVEETAEEAPVAEEKPEPKQCAAITKSGSRCKLQAQTGSDYCHVHSNQEASIV